MCSKQPSPASAPTVPIALLRSFNTTCAASTLPSAFAPTLSIYSVANLLACHYTFPSWSQYVLKTCSKQPSTVFSPLCPQGSLLICARLPPRTHLCASWAAALVVSVPSPRRDRSAGPAGLPDLVPLLPATLEDADGLALPLASLGLVVAATAAPGRVKATLYGDI